MASVHTHVMLDNTHVAASRAITITAKTGIGTATTTTFDTVYTITTYMTSHNNRSARSTVKITHVTLARAIRSVTVANMMRMCHMFIDGTNDAHPTTTTNVNTTKTSSA